MNLRNILQNKSATKLFKNYFFLAAYNVVNLVVPLVIAPYLIRTVGIERFGLIAFCQAFMTYFMIFTDYGFNISGPRSASIAQGNKEELTKIFSRVIISKILLLLLSMFILSSLVMLVPRFRNEMTLILYSFLIVVGQILQPIWFFQGIEEMKFITFLNIVSKVIFTVLVFVFIRRPEHYIYANALQGLGSIATGIMGILLINFYYKIKIGWFGFEPIKKELKDGWPIFISSFSINIFLNANSFILGLFASPAMVGYYSVAEKVMLIIRQLLTVFSQAIYPHVCKIAQESKMMVVQFFRRVFPLLFGGMLVICLGAFVLAGYIATYLVGSYNATTILLIRVLCIAPLVVACNVPAYMIMLAHDMKKQYSAIFVIGALLSIVTNIILSITLQSLGTAISIIITELFITIALHKVLYAHHSEYALLIKRMPASAYEGEKE